MATWAGLSAERPDLVEVGAKLLYQHGVGLAFLATVRDDGHPRVHPMCPILADERLFAFIIPSPKQRDLLRDGRYAMHSFPCEDNEDAFYISGRATAVGDAIVRETVAAQFVDERSAIGVPTPSGDDVLFEFGIESCLLTRTKGHGDFEPIHDVWHAGRN